MDTLTPGIHRIDFHGVSQQYHVYGEGPVCLVQPGGPGVFWEPMRMPLAERHLTMVYIEALGTGASGRLPSHPDGYTRALYGDAIGRIIDDLHQDAVCLLGHSYGGFVAQRYALDHPDRLSGLVLYDSAPVTGEEHAAEMRRQLGFFAHRNANNPELPAVLGALGSVGGITDDGELTDALRGLLPAYFAHYWRRQSEFAQFRRSIQASYISGRGAEQEPDTVDDRETLPACSVPTLVLAGRHDIVCGEYWARMLHKLIPRSRMVLLEDSGHFGHVEEPESFAGALVDFVASVLGRR
jgi:proline iminopeptidase